MNSSRKLKISLLMSGSELMSGDTIDTNSALLAHALADLGLAINEKVTVSDHLYDLESQILRLSSESDLLIINGGLGPTCDDLTAEALAHAAQQPLLMHKDAEKHIRNWCNRRGSEINTANMKQALLPASSQVIPDCPGSAPAFYLMINHCLIIATPGVPSELKKIVRNQLLPLISAKLAITSQPAWKKYPLLGVGEATLQQMITDHLAGIEKTLEIGFRIDFPILELKYRPIEGSADDDKVIAWQIRLHQLIADFITSTSSANPARHLVEQLYNKGNSISCAESCTGGLIASEITKIPGASSVFPGGVISYANTVKQELLNVPAEILANHGAVSKQTVEAMFAGIIGLMKSDYAVAVTGIAGPSGGTAEKPLGTVWIAWGTVTHPLSVGLCIPIERTRFQQLVTTIAIDLCIRHLEGNHQIPTYLARWRL